MFPTEQDGKYHVSSEEINGKNIYKDYMRKRKYNSKIALLDGLGIQTIEDVSEVCWVG